MKPSHMTGRDLMADTKYDTRDWKARTSKNVPARVRRWRHGPLGSLFLVAADEWHRRSQESEAASPH